MSEIKNDYIRINEKTRPGIKLDRVSGIILHYTANAGGSAQNHRDYFNRGEVYASANIFVDDKEAICIVPIDEVSYQANEISKYNANGSVYRPLSNTYGDNANFTTIGVEMCLDRNGNITQETFDRTVRVVKELVAKYPYLKPENLVRHYDITGKVCPASWVANPSELTRFRNAVFSNTTTETIKPTNKNEDGAATMVCIYWKPNAKKNGKDAYYFNGVNHVYIGHPDTITLLKKIYKDNNGKDMPEYQWDDKAPWFARLESISK